MTATVLLDQAGRGRDRTSLVPPRGDLRHVVQSVAYQTFNPAWHDGGDWRVIADTSAHILYSRVEERDAQRSRLVLVGPRTRYIDTRLRGRSGLVAVQLSAGRTGAAIGVDASELVDRAFSLDDVIPSAKRLRIRLDNEAIDEAPDLIQQWLSNHIALNRRRLVLPAFQPLPGTTVRSMCEDLRMNPRQLQRVFNRDFGMSPKLFLRIHRVTTALHSAVSLTSPRWSSIAFSAGFADQSHLTHEFRKLLGETPGQFLSRRDLDWASRSRGNQSPHQT